MSRRILRSWRAVVIVIAALGVFSQPAAVAYAMEATTPPLPTTSPVGVGRLERVWQWEQHRRDRMALVFDHIEQRISHGQTLIDRAKSNGKDVSTVQTALNAFAEAVRRARPIFESTQGIMASHAGFDAEGHVTDIAQASQTVRELGDKLRAVRDTLIGPARELRDAIRSFRETNKAGV